MDFLEEAYKELSTLAKKMEYELSLQNQTNNNLKSENENYKTQCKQLIDAIKKEKDQHQFALKENEMKMNNYINSFNGAFEIINMQQEEIETLNKLFIN